MLLADVKLDKKNPYPVYLQLADVLRNEIKSGRFQADEAFPEERELSRQLDISRPTLRKALKLLEDDDYIYKIRGRGVFISEKTAKLDFKGIEHGTRAVGISFAEQFEDTHSVQTAEGAISLFREHNFQVLRINYLDGLDEKEHILRNRHLLAGLLMYPMRPPNFKHNFNFVRSMGVPFVVTSSQMFYPGLSADYVDSDDIEGVREAIHYFIDNGHKNIAFITCNSSKEIDTGRRSGYINAMKEFRVKENFIVQPKGVGSHTSVANVFEFSMKIFSEKRYPTAILAENDVTAVGIYNALKELQIKVPGEIELIGFGNDLEAHSHFPGRNFPISTVAIPRHELGRKAAEILIERMNNPQLPWRKVKVKTTLVHKETTRLNGN